MKINAVVRYLVVSDFFINAGFSIFAPVVAIFITHQIGGGTLEVVGFSAAITQIVKVLFELPIAKILDKNHGEYDDFYALMFGSVLIALTPFLYLAASTVSHIYILSVVHGIGIAFAAPPWYAIFSRHLDKLQESFEWTLDSISIGLAAAGAAAAGGYLAEKYSFHVVFIIGGLLAIFGGAMQIRIFRHIKRKVARGQVKPIPEKTE